MEHPAGGAFLADLDQAEAALRARLAAVAGALVERKRFAIAVHYRLVAERDLPALERAVAEVHAAHPRLRRTGGKKIHELRPGLDWDKGKAVRWLLRAPALEGPDVLAVYLGDDETDEDAFRALRADGIGVLVAEHPQRSHAHYGLRDPGEAERFLERLAALADRRDE
jgi:alpha,alpha-trehalase